MRGIQQCPCQTSPWEAAFHLALAATHAPCTTVVHVVFTRRMLPPSLSQHAGLCPPTLLAPFPSRSLAAHGPYLAFQHALWTHPVLERFSTPSARSMPHSPPAYASSPQPRRVPPDPPPFYLELHWTLVVARSWLHGSAGRVPVCDVGFLCLWRCWPWMDWLVAVISVFFTWPGHGVSFTWYCWHVCVHRAFGSHVERSVGSSQYSV